MRPRRDRPEAPKSPSQSIPAALSLRPNAFLSDAFSSREPEATSLENAMYRISEEHMKTIFGRLAAALVSLVLMSNFAAAQTKITVAVGGGACLCYLPTILAKQLGEFDKAGLAVELVDLKGGADALKAVLGGSADVVSGYFDHCVNLAAKKQ